uniref:Transposase (putative) gypsy type domain-containing protein n=1 Tax=Setaria viridis TaxID=4556 RepID=A0A4U6VU65_SETVI|nr:hypothetical protein SEVIR_3G310903v2 [Setaria viridis]
MRTKKMGKKPEKIQGKAPATGKVKSKKGKELVLLAPKVGPTNQTAPPPPGVTWQHSMMKEEAVQVLVDAKLLQPKEILEWCPTFPNAWQFEEHPAETVMLVHFVERGLAVPTSDFFRGILEYYNLQLLHLNPNGVLHMSIFVHLCEVYLGVPPSLELFRKLFHCKPQPSAQRTEVFGGAGFQLRNSNAYIEYNLTDSYGDWKKRWFYIGNHDPRLPVVTGHASKHVENWVSEPEDTPELDHQMQQITELKALGLTGINVAASFLKRRVQPLQKRAHSGSEYSGLKDPSCMSDEDISDDDVEALLDKFFRNYQGVTVIPAAFHQYDAWYEPEVSEEESEAVVEESEDEPSPPVKRRRVVRKMSAAKSASTPKKSRDEAVSEEMAVSDPEFGDAAVDTVSERVLSIETMVAPELTAPTPSVAMPPIADQAVLGLPARVAGLCEKTVPAAVPAAPSTRPPVAEKKRVRLPPRSTRWLWPEFFCFVELKKQEAAARSQVIDWRNAHDRVADEAEHLRAALMEAQAACEHQWDRKMQNGVMLAMAMVACRDHAQTLGTLRGELRELSGEAEDLVNAIAPVEEGAGPQSLVERLRAAPSKVARLCKTVCKQVLAVVKSYYPRADLAAAGDGVARNCTEEAYAQYLEEAEPIASKMSEFVSLEEL